MKPLHVLLVDDDGESRATVSEYLRSMGYNHITLARDGHEALQILNRDSTINFVISDWDMPLMSGGELLQRIREDTRFSQLPFLIITSPISHESEKIILAAENTVDAYLIKPFRSELLKNKIDQVLMMTVRGFTKQAIVVDDDTDARETVIEYLKQMGFKDVRGLTDGKAGIDYVSQNAEQIGLIVSDWEMPEVSGVEFLRICKSNPRFQDIPFLMITSQSSIERMKVMQAAKARVDQYLLKPFSGDEIRKRVEQLLEKARSRGEVQAAMEEAVLHLEHGRYQRAQDKFEEALSLDPTHDVALRGLGDILSRTKGVEAGLPFYKRAIEANPVNAKSYLKVANAYEQIGWHEKAIALLQQGIQQISFSSELHFALGRLYYKKNMDDLAKKEFEKTLELQLDHQEARLMIEMMSQGRGTKRNEE